MAGGALRCHRRHRRLCSAPQGVPPGAARGHYWPGGPRGQPLRCRPLRAAEPLRANSQRLAARASTERRERAHTTSRPSATADVGYDEEPHCARPGATHRRCRRRPSQRRAVERRRVPRRKCLAAALRQRATGLPSQVTPRNRLGTPRACGCRRRRLQTRGSTACGLGSRPRPQRKSG